MTDVWERLENGRMPDERHLQAVPSLENSQSMPLENGAFLLPWQFDTEVVPEVSGDIKPPFRDFYRGNIWTEVVYMSDGTPYEVVVGEPIKRITDTPVVFTTAWFTSVEGHNKHTLQKVLELGYPAVLVGPEGGYKPDHVKLKEARRQAKEISLPRSAHNMAQILGYTQPRYHHDEKQLITIGESRGAMVGMGIIPYAAQNDKEVIYSDYVAPCFAEGIEWHELVKLRGQLPHELGSLAVAFAEISVKRLVHLPGTINPRTHYLLHAAHTWEALSNGDAGALARYIPEDQPLQITAFRGDLAGQLKVWRDDIFSEHNQVHISEARGGHLTIANSRTLNKILGRLAALGEQLQEGRIPAEFDFSKIHLKPKLETA